MNEHDLQEIDITIEDAYKAIELGKMVSELESNPLFKGLITEHYFKDNAARLVMLKADPAFQTQEKQDKLNNDMLGISVLGEFLRDKKLLGLMAKDSIEADERTREELREEV